MTTERRILLLNGPNLNMLGRRDPALYGGEELPAIVQRVDAAARAAGFTLSHLQSNYEGKLIEEVHAACGTAEGIIINPGGLSHTSVSLRDALEIFDGPIIEVHLSNIHRREPFRHRSLVSSVAKAVICGFGAAGYVLAVEGLVGLIGGGKQPG